jgi:hypothetical protein
MTSWDSRPISAKEEKRGTGFHAEFSGGAELAEKAGAFETGLPQRALRLCRPLREFWFDRLTDANLSGRDY